MNVVIFHTMINQSYYQLIIPDVPHSFEEHLCQVEEVRLVIDVEDRDHGATTPGTGECGRDKAALPA
jgi:hypothetical protein